MGNAGKQTLHAGVFLHDDVKNDIEGIRIRVLVENDALGGTKVKVCGPTALLVLLSTRRRSNAADHAKR